MTVAELIEALQAMPRELPVVLSKDGEGNNFSPAADFSMGVYIAETTWSGEFTSVDEDMSDAREAGGVSAVCIWPTN